MSLLVLWRQMESGEDENGKKETEDGVSLIGQLRAPCLTIGQTARLLRRTQRYAVTVPVWEWERLPKEAVERLPCGVLALNPRFYRSDTGVTGEPESFPFTTSCPSPAHFIRKM
ncbi:MAG: hypothetical protein HFJ80_06295 [Clostridiales bacterium]|nr:hypothetical protein [Clostridiales bacterium]